MLILLCIWRFHKIKDRSRESKLLKHLGQLLVWLVKGSIEYYKDGVGEPPSVISKTTQEYFDDNDDIQNFFNETCIVDKSSNIIFTDLYELYKQSNYRKLSTKAFGEAIVQKGYIKKRTKKGMIFEGLKFVESNTKD